MTDSMSTASMFLTRRYKGRSLLRRSCHSTQAGAPYVAGYNASPLPKADPPLLGRTDPFKRLALAKSPPLWPDVFGRCSGPSRLPSGASILEDWSAGGLDRPLHAAEQEGGREGDEKCQWVGFESTNGSILASAEN